MIPNSTPGDHAPPGIQSIQKDERSPDSRQGHSPQRTTTDIPAVPDTNGNVIRLDISPEAEVTALEHFRYDPVLQIDSNNLQPGPKPPNAEGSTGDTEIKQFGKQLRRLRNLTDEVLLKRTEWRHEYASLQSRRSFLSNAMNDLMNAMKLNPDIQRNLSGQRSRGKSTGYGVQGLDNRAVIDQITPSTSSSSSGEPNIMVDKSTAADLEVEMGKTQQRNKLYRVFWSDYDAVIDQEKTTTRIGDDLSNLEFRLAAEQEEVQKRMHSSNFISEVQKEMMNEAYAQSEQSSRSSSESSIPPLVAEYFERKGDIGIYYERLQELDFNHEEGLMERGFLHDRGDPVEPSDEEFQSNYKSQRKQIEYDLETAEEEAEMLRKRCEDEGLDPNIHRTSGPSMFPTSTQISGQALSQSHSVAPQVHEFQLRAPFPAVNLDPVNRIDDWRRNVPIEEANGPPNLEWSDAVPLKVSTPLDLERRLSGESVEVKYPKSTASGSTHEEDSITLSLAAYELRSFDLGAFGPDFPEV